MKLFVNVIDKELSSLLLSHGYKLLNHIDSNECKMWTFEYDPHLFSLDFDNKEIQKKCFLSQNFKMTF